MTLYGLEDVSWYHKDEIVCLLELLTKNSKLLTFKFNIYFKRLHIYKSAINIINDYIFCYCREELLSQTNALHCWKIYLGHIGFSVNSSLCSVNSSLFNVNSLLFLIFKVQFSIERAISCADGYFFWNQHAFFSLKLCCFSNLMFLTCIKPNLSFYTEIP